MIAPSLYYNLLKTIKTYRGRYAAAFIFLCLSNVLFIVNPLLIRAKLEGRLSLSFSLSIALFLLIATVAAVSKYLMRVGFISISRDVEATMRGDLYHKLQGQSAAFFDLYGTGELLSRLTNDVAAYRDVLGPGVMYPLFFITFVGPGYFALFSISPKLTLVAATPLIAIPLLNWIIRGNIYRLSASLQEALAQLSNLVQEQVTSIRIIKGYVAEKSMLKRFTKENQTLEECREQLAFYQGVLYPVFSLLARSVTLSLVLSTALIFVYLPEEMTTGDFIAFMWIQSYIFLPILMLGWLLPIYQRGKAAYDRLRKLYMHPDPVPHNTKSIVPIPKNADLHIRNLSFTYPESTNPTIKNLSLTIKRGEWIGITGPIGSGKSTLFKLLLREYEVEKGTICFGDHPIQDFSLNTIFQEISTVEQSPFLFSQTIKENIALAAPNTSFEEIKKAADNASLHDTVETFPEKYDTFVGERGITLSGGQKQRLAIARTFLANRPILLLDDIFSAIDSETEQIILSRMKEAFKDKTLLIISHRLPILNQLDRVLYLPEGTFK